MKVSIITCTLNSAKFIKECLDSIQIQSYDNYEVIIVDGGSTDDTLEIISSYSFSQVFHGIKGGISNAMNFGISKAKGEILSILHSDDFYDNKLVLEQVVNEFRNNPEKKWLFGPIRIKYTDRIVDRPINVDYSPKAILSHNFIPHPGVFVHRDVYREVGLFNTKFKYAMDYDLLLRISKKFQPIQISQYLAVFRNHSNSLSSKNKFKASLESFKVQHKYFGSFIDVLNGYFYFSKSTFKHFLNAWI